MKRPLRYIAIALFAFLSVVTFISCPTTPADTQEMLNGLTKPAKPTGITATAGKPSIEVSWDVVDGVTRYELFKANGEDKNFELVRTFYPSNALNGKITYTDTSVGQGNVILYYVEAVKVVNLTSGTQEVRSDSSEVAVGATEPDIDFYAAQTSKAVKLNWVAKAVSYEGTNLIGSNYNFKLYRDGVVIKEFPASASSYTDTNITPDTTYSYYLEMTYAEGASTLVSDTAMVLTNMNYIPSPAYDIVASDYAFKVDEGKLVADFVTLKWEVRVPRKLIVNPDMTVDEATESEVTNAKPKFHIERSVKGRNDWQTILDFADDADKLVTLRTPDSDYYYFEYALEDSMLEGNTEYEYRIMTRYQFTNSWYTEQDEAVQIAEDTGKTLKFCSDIKISDSNIIRNENTKDISATITWKANEVLPEGLKFVVEKKDLYDNSNTNWTVLDEEIKNNGNGEYSIADSFQLSGDALNESKNYSYRVYYQTTSGTTVTDISSNAVETKEQLFVRGNLTTFDVVDYESITASQDLVNDVVVTWTTNLKPSADDGKVYDLKRDLITYSLHTSTSTSTIVTGNANDETNFDFSKSGDILTVTYRISGASASEQYYVEAKYNEELADGVSLVSNSTTKNVTGRILDKVSSVTAETGAASSITITFKGDPNTSSFRLYYRLQGNAEDWKDYVDITDPEHTSSNTYSYEFNGLADQKGRSIEFIITSVDSEGTESSKPESVQAIGSYFGIGDFKVSASKAITGNVVNTNKIVLSWNDIEGAESYNIYRSESEDGSYALLEDEAASYSKTDDGFTTTDLINETSDKLTGGFWYKVVPVSSSGEVPLSDIEAVQGTYFAPPQNITATKGTYYNGIQISWDSVDGATDYTIYRKLASSSSSDWGSPVGNVGSSDTVFIDDEINGDSSDFIYTVAARHGSDTMSYKQNELSFDSKANEGYALLQVPDSVTYTYNGDGTATVSWLEVKGADSYLFKNWKTEDIEVKETSITIDAYATDSMVLDLLSGYSVKPSNANLINPEDVESRGVINKEIGGRDLISGKELTNEINESLRTHFINADSNFSGDWWPSKGFLNLEQDERKYYDTGNNLNYTLFLKTAIGGGTSGGDSQNYNPGYLELINFNLDSFGILISTERKLYLYANYGSGGYLDTNSLEYIGITEISNFAETSTTKYDPGLIRIDSLDQDKHLYIEYNKIGVLNNTRSGTYSLRNSQDADKSIFNIEISDDETITRLFN